MKNNRAEELMAAYLSGNIKAGEREELMHWVDDSSEGREFFDKAVSLWSVTEQMAYPDFGANKAKSWEQISSRVAKAAPTQTAPQAKVRRLSPLRWQIAATVALALAAGAWWFGQGNDNSLLASTAAGERQEITLPDGSRVWLNENSQLAYAEKGGERYIEFQGEAFFDVATDSLRPFRVYSGQAVTTVLGTSFNLRAYPDEVKVEVSVQEGRVALEKQTIPSAAQTITTDKRVELARGETGVLNKTSAEVSTVAVTQQANNTAWKDRRLRFDDVPLPEVVESLERYYDIEIDLASPGIEKCLVTIGEETEPQLEMMLLLLEGSVGLTVEQAGQQYRFTGQACQ